MIEFSGLPESELESMKKEWDEIMLSSNSNWKIPLIEENQIEIISMTPQEKIIQFKRLKNDLINQIMKENGVKYPDHIAPYYLPIDDNPFATMSDEKAKHLWNVLVLNIFKDRADQLLDNTCPECLAFYIDSMVAYYRGEKIYGCDICPYKKYHGKCGKRESNTWFFLFRKRISAFIENIDYLEMIYKIEGMKAFLLLLDYYAVDQELLSMRMINTGETNSGIAHNRFYFLRQVQDLLEKQRSIQAK